MKIIHLQARLVEWCEAAVEKYPHLTLERETGGTRGIVNPITLKAVRKRGMADDVRDFILLIGPVYIGTVDSRADALAWVLEDPSMGVGHA